MEGESKVMSQTQNPLQFKQIDAELWLVGRLRDHIAQIFTGGTDPEIRRERIRRAIMAAELSAVILGKNNATGKAETYADAFERLYHEPLQPKTRKGK